MLGITVVGAVAGFVMLAVGAAAPANSSALAAVAAAAAVGALVLMAMCSPPRRSGRFAP